MKMNDTITIKIDTDTTLVSRAESLNELEQMRKDIINRMIRREEITPAERYLLLVDWDNLNLPINEGKTKAGQNRFAMNHFYKMIEEGGM